MGSSSSSSNLPNAVPMSSSFIMSSVEVVLLVILITTSIIIQQASASSSSSSTENNDHQSSNSNNPFSSSSSVLKMKMNINHQQPFHHNNHPLLLSKLLPVQHYHDAYLNHLLTNNRFASNVGGGNNDYTVRTLQEESGDGEDDDCTNDPFLWSIHRSSDDEVLVGFGIGTIHFPTEYVVDDDAFQLITQSIDDSCIVYGEIDFFIDETLQEIQSCSIEIASEGTIFVSDLTDSDIITKIQDGLTEILNEYILFPNQRPIIQQALEDSIPIWTLIHFIQVYNTPSNSYKDSYFESQFVTGILEPILDIDIMELGRPYTASIESVQTQCLVLNLLNPSPSEFWNDYDTHWRLLIEHSLNTNFSPLFDFYKCGNLQHMTNWLKEESNVTGSVFEENVSKFLFDERNLQMGEFIVDKLNNQPSTNAPIPSVFVVGLGHWIFGESNLLEYLQQEENGNYTLRRITTLQKNQDENENENEISFYNQDTYPNMSNEICDATIMTEPPPPPPPTISPTAAMTAQQPGTSPPTTTSSSMNNNTVAEGDHISMSGDTSGIVEEEEEEEDDHHMSMSGDPSGTSTTTTTTTANNDQPNDESSSSSSSASARGGRPFDCYGIGIVVATALLFQDF